MSTLEVRVPGRVWEDALDPAATGMQAALELPQPRRQKKGRGWIAVYDQVPTGVAFKLAKYLSDRATTLAGQAPEPREREVYRVMANTAWIISQVAQTVRASQEAG